jgi:hypothetical protein
VVRLLPGCSIEFCSWAGFVVNAETGKSDIHGLLEDLGFFVENKLENRMERSYARRTLRSIRYEEITKLSSLNRIRGASYYGRTTHAWFTEWCWSRYGIHLLPYSVSY